MNHGHATMHKTMDTLQCTRRACNATVYRKTEGPWTRYGAQGDHGHATMHNETKDTLECTWKQRDHGHAAVHKETMDMLQ